MLKTFFFWKQQNLWGTVPELPHTSTSLLEAHDLRTQKRMSFILRCLTNKRQSMRNNQRRACRRWSVCQNLTYHVLSATTYLLGHMTGTTLPEVAKRVYNQ